MGKDSIIPSKPTPTSESVSPEVNSVAQISPEERASERVPFKESVVSIIKKYGLTFNHVKKQLKKTSSLYLRDTGGQVERERERVILNYLIKSIVTNG